MRSKALLALAAAVIAMNILGPPILHASRPASAGRTDHHAALLELFTSEGCSSCPPADAFLRALDDAGHVDDVEIIVIEEYVDYWNRLGWTDPFSSHNWSERQDAIRAIPIHRNSSSKAAAKSSAVPRAMHVHRSSQLQKVQRPRSIFRWRACL